MGKTRNTLSHQKLFLQASEKAESEETLEIFEKMLCFFDLIIAWIIFLSSGGHTTYMGVVSI